jgi:hypothetical protein
MENQEKLADLVVSEQEELQGEGEKTLSLFNRLRLNELSFYTKARGMIGEC